MLFATLSQLALRPARQATRQTLALACAALLFGTAAQAQTTAGSMAAAAPAATKPLRSDVGGDKPRSLLWVGNSFFYYNNSMHSHLASLSRAADLKPGLRGVSVAISASGLDWHDMASYLKPGVLGKYSFAEDNSVRFNKGDRQFDAVIMMDCSQCPVHPQLKQVFHDTVKAHAQTILKAGARPVLFMSWAYKDKPEMTAQLAEQYTVAANANDALVIPAGLAFAKSMAKRPEVELYMPDLRHPTLAGTYLSACTVYASVTGQSPVGNSYTAGLSAEAAAHLQAMAWQTVQEYVAK
jgi:hypothetical protein